MLSNWLHRALFPVSLLLVLVIAGCGAKSSGSIVEGKVNAVTTFYPIYEFTKEIGGEDANVINLLPVGVEPHDWTPRSQDIVNTSKAQLFLYNGAGLEGWVPGFLKGLDSDSKVQSVEVSKGVNLIMTDEDDGHNHGSAAEDHEGEEAGHDHEGEAEHAHEGEEVGHEHEGEEAGHDHEGEAEHAHEGEEAEAASGDSLHTDPHTWVSPKSALVMAGNIRDSLQAADPEHKDGYEERYNKLAERLKALDVKFEQELAKLPGKEIVVSHQAFAYLARDYGLTQHAIMGLSPDAEPRGQDMVKLASMVKEEGIKYIFFEELVSDRLAKTLAAEAGVSTMVLNPVEGLTEEQDKNADNYFTLMEKNLQNLILALQ
ncbi:metal ABC transporter solute-binding protein, Zn/Mn family [Paenibacillus donghaensis]|uniref:ABC transporter substrate-binding protein n=1 Tax=Paenibacillus donghaensis TaxID=414771 RepID=A0A2Z2KGJ5_9BACL|nr:zinc ABC transporter substrate-binding protein [Paenibacillus donghaensis]ASA23155.1 ABC transporter substrate-binding protein [Paenibacillus donghaensis]